MSWWKRLLLWTAQAVIEKVSKKATQAPEDRPNG